MTPGALFTQIGPQPAAALASRGVRAALLIAVMCLLSACSTVVKTSLPGALPLALAQAELGYAAVLQRHVNDQGEVDFAALRDDKSSNSSSGIRALEA